MPSKTELLSPTPLFLSLEEGFINVHINMLKLKVNDLSIRDTFILSDYTKLLVEGMGGNPR